MANIDDELRKAFDKLQQSDKEIEKELQRFLGKFSNIEQFLREAAETVDYYFNIQNTYGKKKDFICYIKGIITIYVSYMNEAYGFEDEEIENIIEFIEDNYDFLIYFGEEVNPVYRRIHSPNGCSIRRQLKPRSQKRLALLLESYNSVDCFDDTPQ